MNRATSHWSATDVAQALAKQTRGSVSLPDNVDYRASIAIDNGRIVREPRLIVVPSSIDDVATIVKYATDEGIRVTIKSGGHSATGYCLNNDGIVIDMRDLNQISLDRHTGRARIGAGARWRDVYSYMELGGTNRIPIGGGCLGVGVSGFLLGGGFSFVSRSYGLGSDSVTKITMVTAGGEIVELSNEEIDAGRKELLWASRGGGGGNFGVVTEFEIETHSPRAETMLCGQITFPFYRIEELLGFYSEWERKLPNEMAVYGYVGAQPDPRNGGTPLLALRFTPVYNGDFGEGTALLQPLLNLRPISSELHQMTLPEWEAFSGSVTSVDGRSAYMRSAVLKPGGLDGQVARTVMKYMSRCPSPGSFMVWTHLGGAVERNTTASAFPHRAARFVPEIKSIWDSTRPDQMRTNVEWAYDFFEELAAEAPGAYVNYIDPLLVGWQNKYYGENYARLVEVKKEWDPGGFFDFQQGVASSHSPGGNRPLDLSPLFKT